MHSRMASVEVTNGRRESLRWRTYCQVNPRRLPRSRNSLPRNLTLCGKRSLLLSNDNEQYTRRNNLRIRGLVAGKNTDCRKSVIDFLAQKMNIHDVQESDIEAAHGIAAANHNTADDNQPATGAASKVTVVRFVNQYHRDMIIRSRKVLKGTSFSIAEDLTSLNVKTVNRLRSDDRVTSTWTWNGRIYALLQNGKKVLVHPFQPVDELL
jgi:hypothetical protein